MQIRRHKVYKAAENGFEFLRFCDYLLGTQSLGQTFDAKQKRTYTQKRTSRLYLTVMLYMLMIMPFFSLV